jgi:hypothetical protein
VRIAAATVILAGAGSVGACVGLAGIETPVALYLLGAFVVSNVALYLFGCQDGQP